MALVKALNTTTINTRDARLVWKGLNGVFAIYKPVDVSVKTVKSTIASNLSQDLNKLNVRLPNNYIKIIGETNKELKVVTTPNYADQISVVGPRYQCQDIKMATANTLPYEASGVVLIGIQGGMTQIFKIRESSPTKYFKVSAKLGQARSTGFITGKLVEQTTYKHVSRMHIDKLCASIQSSHQKSMFKSCGVDMRSQAAYELAKQGPIRPADKNYPMIYSIKCTNFSPPYFDLEIVCMNERMEYIQELIDEIGIKLKTSATCTRIICSKYGLFDSNIALLTKHWRLTNILNNMSVCRNILRDNQFLLGHSSPHLIEVDDNK